MDKPLTIKIKVSQGGWQMKNFNLDAWSTKYLSDLPDGTYEFVQVMPTTGQERKPLPKRKYKKREAVVADT